MSTLQSKGNHSPRAASQEGLVSAMIRPGFYPKSPPEVTHKETHISHLFFVGELVYKIKKAVRFSFLDYSTLLKRRHFLQEELRLNRRLAPSVYLAVMPITLDESGWRLGGWGQPAEYTLIMRRLPERRMLPFLLESGQLTADMMRGVAEVLAPFHAHAEAVRYPKVSGYPSIVKNQWAENLRDLQPFVGTLIESETMRALERFGDWFIDKHHDLLIRRADDGWIRDVHGDLHGEHVCFAPEGIQIFDCIEFSSKLRHCDLAAEVAFFIMDLEARGGAAAAQSFLTRYRELLDDPGLSQLLPFYECHRALVRGKVHALRSGAEDEAAARYVRFAARFTWLPFKPFLVMICGLSGSGKSTLARQLSDRLGLPHINSDTVRKSMVKKLGRQTGVPFNEGIYRPTVTERTYAAMTREAEKHTVNGCGAILDATYIRKAHREKLVRMAEKYRVPLLVIHCLTSDDTTRRRLDQRAERGTDISDGRWEIYLEQKLTKEPMAEIPPEVYLQLDTDGPVDQLVSRCEKHLRSCLEPGLN